MEQVENAANENAADDQAADDHAAHDQAADDHRAYDQAAHASAPSQSTPDVGANAATAARELASHAARYRQNARPVFELTRPVFFVGFMVAGKTSVARRLARTCGVASVDLDTYLERREGKTVNQMFADVGEDGFRAMETAVLSEFSQREPLLISCGGGAVLRPENRTILKEGGFVVYLIVTAEQAFSRVKDVASRPLFRDLDTARATISARLPLYEEVADVAIDTVGKNVPTIAREVRRVLEREGILWQRK